MITMMRITMVFVIITLFIGTGIPSIHSIHQPDTIKESNSTQSDVWVQQDTGNISGYAVSIDGEYALIGTNGGPAYVFKRVGSDWMMSFDISSPIPPYSFGRIVSLNGDYAAIGSEYSVYIYHRSSFEWVYDFYLSFYPDTPSICMNDGKLAIGSGSEVYIYEESSDWSQEAVINHSSTIESVFIDGNLLVLAAFNGVYLYEYEDASWNLVTRLGDIFHRYGEVPVAIDGYCVIAKADNLESVYVYKPYMAWRWMYTLEVSSDNNGFGCSLAMRFPDIIIGAKNAGYAYIFDTNGNYQAKLAPSDNPLLFGQSVDIDDDYAIVGSTESTYFFHKRSNTPPDLPDQPLGPNTGFRNHLYSFTTKTSDAEDDELYYMWDWGDGTTSEWMGPYISDVICQATHSWGISGEYDITVKAKDVFNRESDWSDPLVININNSPPNKPVIGGPATGIVGEEQEYNFYAIDPEDDDVLYYIDWGDGSNTGWFGPFPSGNELYRSHIWESKDVYNLRIRAKDVNNAEGEWTTLQVSMPKAKIYNTAFHPFFKNILEDYPFLFFGLRSIVNFLMEVEKI